MSILLAAIAQNIVQLNGGESIKTSFSSPSSATISFNSDGTISGLDSGASAWFSLAPQIGAGSDYEIFAERVSGDLPSGILDTWLSLSSDRNWSVTQTGAGSKACSIRVKIRTTSGALLASAVYSMSIEVF